MYNLSRILPLKHLDLAAIGGHTASQVAIEEELELELLELAAVVITAALLPLAPGLEVTALSAAKQLLKGVLEVVGRLAKEGVAGSSVGQVVLKRVKVNNRRLLAKQHLLYKAVAVADSFSNYCIEVGQVDQL